MPVQYTGTLSFKLLTPACDPVGITPPNGEKCDTTAKESVNKLIGAMGRIKVKVFIGIGRSIQLPNIPVYCEYTAVPITLHKDDSDTRCRVCPYYRFDQPYIASMDTLVFHASIVTTGVDNCHVTNPNNGLNTWGFCDYAVIRNGAALRRHSFPFMVYTGTITKEYDIHDGFDTGELYYPQIDLVNYTADAQGYIYVTYRFVPLNAFTASNQAHPDALTWKNRQGGRQQLVLIQEITNPAAVTTTGLFIRYPFKNTPIPDTEPYASHGATLIFEDKDCSIYSSVISRDRKFNCCFGVKAAGESRIAYPQNLTLLLPQSVPAADAAAFSDTITVVSIQAVASNIGQQLAYLVKLEFAPGTYPEIEYYYNAGYALVYIVSYKVNEVSWPYTLCGSIADYRITGFYVVRQNKTIVNVPLNALNQLSSGVEDGYEILATLTGLTGGMGMYPLGWVFSGTYNNPRFLQDMSVPEIMTPVNQVTSRCRLYANDQYYAMLIAQKTEQLSYGKPVTVMSHTPVSDGHGEVMISAAAHLMTQQSFPVIYPAYICHSQSDRAYGLALKRVFDEGNYRSIYRLNEWLETFKNTDNYVMTPHRMSYAYDILHGLSPGPVFNAAPLTRLDFCNAVTGPADSPYLTPVVGSLSIYSTPAIGSGGVPMNADFALVALGIELSTAEQVNIISANSFGNDMIGYAPDKLYRVGSKYRFTTTQTHLIQKFKSTGISGVYVIGAHLFLSYANSVAIYSIIDQDISRSATLPGALVPNPTQSGGTTYVATKIKEGAGFRLSLYSFGSEGLSLIHTLPVHDACVVHIPALGACLTTLYGEVANTYALYGFSPVLINKQSGIIRLVYAPKDDYSNVIFVGRHQAFELSYGTVPAAFTIKTDEIHFPYAEDTSIILTGLVIEFAEGYSPFVNPVRPWTFALNVYANKKVVFSRTNLTAKAKTVIRFNSVPVGTAKYEIMNCTGIIRNVKWLCYRLPVLMEEVALDLGHAISLPDAPSPPMPRIQIAMNKIVFDDVVR